MFFKTEMTQFGTLNAFCTRWLCHQYYDESESQDIEELFK